VLQKEMKRRAGKPAIAVYHPEDVDRERKKRNPDAERVRKPEHLHRHYGLQRIRAGSLMPQMHSSACVSKEVPTRSMIRLAEVGSDFRILGSPSGQES
jgi:hypothetical protein